MFLHRGHGDSSDENIGNLENILISNQNIAENCRIDSNQGISECTLSDSSRCGDEEEVENYQYAVTKKQIFLVKRDNSLDQLHCLTCGKTFSRKRQCQNHIKRHLQRKKEYRCTFNTCIKTYKSKENLNLHIKNIHMKIKPYKCQFCEAVFSHRNGRSYHERKLHTGHMPFTCHFPGM